MSERPQPLRAINKFFDGKEPWQIVSMTASSLLAIVWVHSLYNARESKYSDTNSKLLLIYYMLGIINLFGIIKLKSTTSFAGVDDKGKTKTLPPVIIQITILLL